jgi:hypothetical protein
VEYHQTAIIKSVNGQTVSTNVLESHYKPVVVTEYEDQPDRIQLDMSLEEAQALHTRMACFIGAYDCFNAFQELERALYPKMETGASTGPDNACAGKPVDPNKWYSEPSSLLR